MTPHRPRGGLLHAGLMRSGDLLIGLGCTASATGWPPTCGCYAGWRFTNWVWWHRIGHGVTSYDAGLMRGWRFTNWVWLHRIGHGVASYDAGIMRGGDLLIGLACTASVTGWPPTMRVLCGVAIYELGLLAPHRPRGGLLHAGWRYELGVMQRAGDSCGPSLGPFSRWTTVGWG